MRYYHKLILLCFFLMPINLSATNSITITKNINYNESLVSAVKLKMMLRNNTQIQLIDVRGLKERQESNIGGVHIPLDKLEKNLYKLNPNKFTVVYCRTGRRSKIAVELLKKNNFKQAYSLDGGIYNY